MNELNLMTMLLATGDNETDTYTTRSKTKDADGNVVAKSKTVYHVLPTDTTTASRVRAAKHGITATVAIHGDTLDATRKGIVASNIIGQMNGMSTASVGRILKDREAAEAATRDRDTLSAELRGDNETDDKTATEARATAEPVKPETVGNGKPGKNGK